MSQLITSRRAFTLIELLIVIGIIGVIAAIMLPVFFSIRESSRRAVCLSNERQVGMAMFQYLGDNDDVFPPSLQDAGVGWAEKCYPYVNTAQMFRCPDDPTLTIHFENTPVPWVPVSYGLNSNLGGAIIPSLPPYHNRQHETAMLSAVSAPAQTVMLFEISDNRTSLPMGYLDLGQSASGNAGDDCGTTAHTYPCTGTIGFDVNYLEARYSTGNVGARLLNGTEGSIPRHRGGANYLACDGHAKWLKPQSVSGGTNAAAQECAQGAEQPQPGECAGQLPGSAAGTSNSKYSLTFSIR